MMIKKQGQLLGVKKVNEKEEQKQLAFPHMKFLEDGLMQDGIRCICHIHCSNT